MWTNENRAKYNRDHLRYPSDLTDDEWALVEPFIPPPKPGGGKRKQDMRAVMNGVMYILSTGCQWRYLPKDFPPRSTVHNYFIWWHCDGVLDRIHHALYVECREQAEREGSPTACIIDAPHQALDLDLPRFGGRLRSWDQGIRSDGTWSSFGPFFCSAPGGAILPSRPARRCGRRAQRGSRTAPSWGRPKGLFLTAASTMARSRASGSTVPSW